MDDFLIGLAPRSGVPFAALFIFAALLTSLAVGTFLFFTHRGRRLRRGIGAVLMAGALAHLALWAWADARLDWNPQLTASELHGRWRDEGASLELAADGGFVLHDGAKLTGSWALTDWTLRLRPDAGPPEKLRAVRVGKALRLVRRPPGDLDTWDGDLGFERDPGAPSPL